MSVSRHSDHRQRRDCRRAAGARLPPRGKTFIKDYASREIAGAIWVYFGDRASAPAPILPMEATSPEWSSYLFMTVWNCNWQIALDNRLDPIHGSFLHEGTFTLGAGRKDAFLKIEETPTGFQTERTNQHGVNIDWHEAVFHRDNAIWVTTEIPYPPSFGGGSFRINGFPTPIDKDSTLVWSSSVRDRSRAGSATCGISSTRTASKRARLPSSIRTASCWKPSLCRPTSGSE